VTVFAPHGMGQLQHGPLAATTLRAEKLQGSPLRCSGSLSSYLGMIYETRDTKTKDT
jgi:hypothetical protein